MGLPLGFLNVSPFEVDENKEVKTVVDPISTNKKKKRRKKKKVIPPDYVQVNEVLFFAALWFPLLKELIAFQFRLWKILSIFFKMYPFFWYFNMFNLFMILINFCFLKCAYYLYRSLTRVGGQRMVTRLSWRPGQRDMDSSWMEEVSIQIFSTSMWSQKDSKRIEKEWSSFLLSLFYPFPNLRPWKESFFDNL